jgi:hypothetical protein
MASQPELCPRPASASIRYQTGNSVDRFTEAHSLGQHIVADRAVALQLTENAADRWSRGLTLDCSQDGYQAIGLPIFAGSALARNCPAGRAIRRGERDSGRRHADVKQAGRAPADRITR